MVAKHTILAAAASRPTFDYVNGVAAADLGRDQCRADPADAEPQALVELSLRQMEVLARLCQGLTNKAIALELVLSEKTVKSHVTIIFRVLGVVNRTQAVLVAKRLGIG